MRVDIFCESGEKYGLGHLRRCENLLLHLQEVFPTIKFQSSFHSSFCYPDYELEVVIVDSYIAPLSFYENLRCQVLICLDDYFRLPYPHNALILRPTLGAKTFSKSYGGEDYVILNPVFTQKKITPTQKNKILINLGGSNQNNLIKQILKSIHGDIHILNPYFKHPKAHHSLNPQEICSLIDSSEIVICAGGGGLNEALSRGKKIIALCIANNQRSQLQNAHFLPSLFTIFSHTNLSSKLSCALNALVSMPSPPPKPLGLRLRPWLYKTFLPILSAKNAKHFCLLSHKQKLEVLSIRNQEEVRANSLNSAPIGIKEHLRFIANLSFSQFFWAFFEDERKKGEIIAVGSLSLKEGNKATLGIYKNLRYKHIGEKILHSLIDNARKLNINTIELEVLQTNTRAICLYEKFGFAKIQENQKFLTMEKNL